MKTQRIKKGDVVKVPKHYLNISKIDELKMVKKVYYRVTGKNKVKMLLLQGNVFTQDLPANEVKLWIKA